MPRVDGASSGERHRHCLGHRCAGLLVDELQRLCCAHGGEGCRNPVPCGGQPLAVPCAAPERVPEPLHVPATLALLQPSSQRVSDRDADADAQPDTHRPAAVGNSLWDSQPGSQCRGLGVSVTLAFRRP